MQKNIVMRIVLISVIAIAAVASIVLAVILLNKDQPATFVGFVVENSDRHILVEPQAGSEIRNDHYYVSMKIGKENNIVDEQKNSLSFESLYDGSIVEITYSGEIMETNPPQIEAFKIVRLEQL